ncbi:DUF4326 domain-containing protein [Streptomyces prasinus]
MPTRIQRRRTAGWRKPEGAVYVGRGSRYGNPFTVDLYVKAGRIGYLDRAEGCQLAAADFRQWLVDNDHGLWCGPRSESDTARAELLAAIPQLAGRDLMCWCPLPEPGQPDHCHAAVLLSIAAGEEI